MSSQDAFFRILARPSNTGATRLGMAVSKKVHKSAVVRNRIKRVVRESFRAWQAGQVSPPDKALDIVVLARPASATQDNRILFSSLAGHWGRIGESVDQKFTMNQP